MFNEGGFIENLTVLLYFTVLVHNIFDSVKKKISCRYILLSSIVILLLMQRELSLFRMIGTAITTREVYGKYNSYIHIIAILPIIILFFKDYNLYCKKTYIPYLLALFITIFISQIPDLLNLSSILAIGIEETLECTIPIFIFFLQKKIRYSLNSQ